MDRPVVLITGGSRGIGRAAADALAPDHHLLIGGRDGAAVSKVCEALPSAAPFVCDVTDADATARAAARVGRLDVLIHSAGVSAPSTIEGASRALWREVLELNVVAVADLTRLLLPALRTAEGQLVFINSGSGFNSSAGNGVYAASKFALRALADAVREEERGVVRVTSIHPGRVDTDMQREVQRSMGKPYRAEDHLRPESVAAVIRAAVVATPEAAVETLSIRPAR